MLSGAAENPVALVQVADMTADVVFLFQVSEMGGKCFLICFCCTS
jgi:hypothetical protein